MEWLTVLERKMKLGVEVSPTKEQWCFFCFEIAVSKHDERYNDCPF